jgi:hypothetical protein
MTLSTTTAPLIGHQAAAEAHATGRPPRSHRRAAVADRRKAAAELRAVCASLKVRTR